MKIAVVGLGYIGLPLAVEFGKKYSTVGIDLSVEKVATYRNFIDPTGEVSSEDLHAATQLSCHTDPQMLHDADFIVVAVPTPVDEAHQPDFTPLVKSSESVGKYIKRGAIVVYESTVYPGATEEGCIPLIEKHSGLSGKKTFLSVTALSVSTREIKSAPSPRSSRSCWATHRKHLKRLAKFMVPLLRQEFTQPAASKWPKPLKLSKIPSVI